VEEIERAVVGPAAEIVIDRAPRWQVPRQRGPLAAGAQDVQKTIHQIPLDTRALVTARPGGWDQRPDPGPLVVRQIARVAQSAAIVASPVLSRPHVAPQLDEGDKMVIVSRGSSRQP
jgi:hypothetical protein